MLNDFYIAQKYIYLKKIYNNNCETKHTQQFKTCMQYLYLSQKNI